MKRQAAKFFMPEGYCVKCKAKKEIIDAVEETELRNFLRKRLADYKVPRKIIVLPALPRNATGKILKTALRELPVGD